jgi:hypothetical protein
LAYNKKDIYSTKETVRIRFGAKPRHSCRSLFKCSEILPLPCKYTFPSTNFTAANKEQLQRIHPYKMLVQAKVQM